MINRTISNELSGSLGQEITLQGWVRRIREVSAGLVFLIVADRSGEAQVVLSGSLTSQLPPLESVVEITGVVQVSRSRVFPHELAANHLKVLSKAEPLPFPIYQSELGLGLDLMDKFRPLALRHTIYQDVFR
ncbi:MAG: OB-fold nucleic acid binding domain-containing protein, partial [Bacillota bacterium]|nr:OB-fold nucleic acid binding domain-containing protein [Bacillota bacterium]